MALVDVTCPMAGSIWKVHVKVGDAVAAGQEVLVLESMKMEIPIEAPAAGTVAAVHVTEGEKVNEGQLLLSIDGS
ncbi:MAG: acetyl-CoA carboxylase biotin carboxyl carrier protein subunit [Dehalococcoidia bacterium]